MAASGNFPPKADGPCPVPLLLPPSLHPASWSADVMVAARVTILDLEGKGLTGEMKSSEMSPGSMKTLCSSSGFSTSGL